MYTSVRNRPHAEVALEGRRGSRVAANVVLLGLVSLFTDLSQEMVVAVLPLYLTLQLGLTPFAFGIVDGLYGGATAVVRLLGGIVADRGGRYKEVAGAGYGLSALSKLGLVSVSSAAPLAGLLMLDRLGKGIRTAPRDALISLSSDRASLGRSFGVHRALDTVGALLGPLVAFVLLARLADPYDSIFMISFAVSLIGLGILVLFVRNRRPDGADDEHGERASLRAALRLLAAPRFRTVVLVGAGLGLLTISDAFVYVVVQREGDVEPHWFPLLFFGTAVAYLALAVPFGRLADRVGRGRVFLGGHVALLGVYALLLAADLGSLAVLAILVLLGVYYAATDGVLMALASAVLPGGLRTSGLALVTTATALSRFVSSLAFGALWSASGADGAVLVFAVALLVALPVAGLALARTPEAAL